MKRKWIVRIFLFILFVLAVAYAELLTYGLMQLRGQLRVSFSTISIEDAIKNPDFDEDDKKKLKQILNIREFAFNDLGIHRNKNYTKFHRQDDRTTMWVLSACAEFAFEPYSWSFPIVGSFPYKGFFNLNAAKKEEEKLKSLGYDCRIGKAGAWSTLGWFTDPVLSGMLKRNEGSIAELIIHELTHGSVFVKDSIDFNENLATFIGEQGALLYLSKTYPNDSSKIYEYISGESDYIKFSRHMLRGASMLDSLYKTFSEDMSYEEKFRKKNMLIAGIVSGIDELQLSDPDRYLQRYKEHSPPNNADFMSFKRYRERQDVFDTMLRDKFGGDLSKMIAWLIRKHPA